MIRKLTIVTLAFLVLTGGKVLIAQQDEQRERINREREAYFTEHLELTHSEAEAFWPIYYDFYNRKMKLIDDEHNTYKYAHKNADNLSDREITEILEKVYALKSAQLELEKEFYQDKFMKVLPHRKVLKLGKVEWDFRKYLMRKLRDEERGRNRGGGPGRQDIPQSQDTPVPLPHDLPF